MLNIYESIDEKKEKELNMYITIYCTFNDNSLSNADNAMSSNGIFILSAKEIRQKNIELLREVMKNGITLEEIIREIPEARLYIKEIEMHESVGDA